MHPRRSWRRNQRPTVTDAPASYRKTSPVLVGVLLGCASGISSFLLYEGIMGSMGSWLERYTSESHELYINYPLACTLILATFLLCRAYAKRTCVATRQYYTSWALAYCCTNPLIIGVMLYVGAYKLKYALT